MLERQPKPADAFYSVDNDTPALYQGIKDYILNSQMQQKHKQLAVERGKRFNKDVTIAEMGRLLIKI